MKQIIVLVGFLFFVSCNTSTNKGTVTSPEGVPTGAVEVPYEDTPSISKVTTSDLKGNTTSFGINVNGVREGSYFEYHPNGLVKSVTGYVNGKREGQALVLDDRGQVLERMTYHNDLLEGPYTKFNRTRIKEEWTYKNGEPDGECKIYYDTGEIMEDSFYKNGKRDGKAQWFDRDGNVTIDYTYKDGEWLKDEK